MLNVKWTLSGRIKHTEKTVYIITDRWFKSVLERDNQENIGESFRSSMHLDCLLSKKRYRKSFVTWKNSRNQKIWKKDW